MADMTTRVAVLETELSNLQEDYREQKLSIDTMKEDIQRQCRAITEMKNTLKNIGKLFALVTTLGPTIGVLIAKWVM